MLACRPPHRITAGVFLPLAALALSCGRPVRTTHAEAPADPLSEPVPHDRYPDDVGRFLAGLPAKPGSQLAGLHGTDAWRTHRRELDRAWARLENGPLPRMRAFQRKVLANFSSALFYPFSGPDTLMATTFFPQSPTYVMVGLEPAGTLPAKKQIERKDLDRYLARIRVTVASELGRSFFITREMDRAFRGQVTDGLFQPIVQLLVRTNNTVLGFRYIRLDDAGRVVERAPDYRAPGSIGNKGVEIEFRNDAGSSVHRLLYISVNLSDRALKDNPPFLKFLSGLQHSSTFLKATSYMLHKPEFSIIRDGILANSAVILQDDSGIPYRFFGEPAWRVQLYGDYVRPYGSFRWLEQRDLRAAYRSTGPKPLEFRIGYGYSRVPSNLLVATRNERM